MSSNPTSKPSSKSRGNPKQGIARAITDHKWIEAQLREAHERAIWLARFPEENPDPIIRVSKDGTVLYCNPASERAHGLKCKVGQVLQDKLLPLVGRAMVESGEVQHVVELEGRFYILWTVPFLEDGYVNIYGREITELKRAEESLKESEEKYRTILENIEDGYFEVDIAGNLTFFNDPLCRMLGYSKDEMMGMNNRKYTDQENAQKLYQAFNKVYRTGEPIKGFGWEVVAKDGTKLFGEVSVSLIRDSKGQATGFRGIARDITERRSAEEALREYERVIENSQDMIAVVDQDYKYVLANSQFLKYHLLNREQVIGRSVRDVVGEEVFERVLKKNIDACFQGEAVHYEMTHTYPELGERDLLVRYFPVENPEGIRRIVSIIQDITERKRAEEDRKNLDARIQRMEKMEALGTLAGRVAHDLNNILSGIVGYPDLILTQLPEDSPLKVSILAIKQSGQKAAEVVQDLMTLARRGTMSMGVLNWNSVISDYMKTPEQEKIQSLHPRVRFEVLLESDLLSIKGSRVHLSNTLMNLVSNAAEAIPERGVVTISTRNQYLEGPVRGYDDVKEGDYVVLEVSDTGGGISTEDMSRIFEPFYTRKLTGRSGMGLGLSVVWATVKDHSGYIDVQSGEGRRTTFTLYFPVTRDPLTLDQSPVSLSDYMGEGETILVIDDVKEQRELVVAMLSKLNYRVTSVSSGEAAIEYMKTGQPDLLILDMIMDPGMDGLETYGRILESRSGQKAIIVSGFSETERVRQALDLGAGAFVKKPYTIEKIGQAIRRELDKTKRHKLLVIDDSEQIVDILTRFLSQKYDVITANKGLDGLKALETHEGNVDLVITDLVMPEISGIGVISLIRKKYPGISVIAITGKGEHPVALATEAHADVVLKKPFELVDLDRHVTELLAKKG